MGYIDLKVKKSLYKRAKIKAQMQGVNIGLSPEEKIITWGWSNFEIYRLLALKFGKKGTQKL
jgi:hypothetical protein